MKIIGIVFGIIIVIVIIGVIGYFFFGTTISPKNIYIMDINVTDTKILVKADYNESGSVYRSSMVTFDNGKMYINIKGVLAGVLPESLIQRWPVVISIDKNKYGKINEIYLQGFTPSDNILIWPKK
jgi:hypothetical protein